MPFDEVARMFWQAKAWADDERQRERQRFQAAPPLQTGPSPDELDEIAGLAEPMPEQPGLTDILIGGGARIVPAAGGAILGGVFGGLPGAVAGGAAGSALGETLGQGYEVARGLRPEISPAEIGVETALGGVLSAFPGGKTIPRAMMLGAGQAMGGSVAREYMNDRPMPGLGDLGLQGAVGAAFGGGTKWGIDKLLARRAPKPPLAPPEPGYPALPPAPVRGLLGPAPAEFEPVYSYPIPPFRQPTSPLESQLRLPAAPRNAQPPSSLEGLLRLGEGERGVPSDLTQPPLPGVAPVGGAPHPMAGGQDSLPLKGSVFDPRQMPLAANDLAEIAALAEPLAPAPVAAPRPVAPAEPPTPFPAPAEGARPPLRVAARFGPEARVVDVTFPRNELEELFRGANRVQARTAGRGTASARLQRLADWIQQTYEVDLKSRGTAGLRSVASSYRKAVLDAVKAAPHHGSIVAPDLELLLPEPRSNLRSMYRTAKREGFTGTPEELAQAAQMEEVNVLAHDPDQGSGSPRALIRAVANVGGIGSSPKNEYPEVLQQIRELAWRRKRAPGRVLPDGTRVKGDYLPERTAKGKMRKGSFAPTGSVEGMVVYDAVGGHQTFDSLQEALIESYPQFEHLANSRDLADALESAIGEVSADTSYQAPFAKGWWRQFADEGGRFRDPSRASAPELEMAPGGYPASWDNVQPEPVPPSGVSQPRFNLLRPRPQAGPPMAEAPPVPPLDDLKAQAKALYPRIRSGRATEADHELYNDLITAIARQERANVPPVRPEPAANAAVPPAGLDVAAGQASPVGAVPPAGAEPRPGRDWGTEAGRASPRLLAGILGGTAGAAYGGVQGDTPEERAKNAVGYGAMGAFAGVSLGALAGRGAPRVPGAPPPPNRAPVPPRVTGEGQVPPIGRNVVPPGQQNARFQQTNQPPIPPPGPIPASRLQHVLDYFPAHLRDGIKDIYKEHGFFAAQRGGVQHHAATVAKAARIQVEMDRVTPRGTAMNAAQKHALATAAANVTDAKYRVAQRIAADAQRGVRNDADLLELERLTTQTIALWQSYAGVASEAGRALEAQKILKRMLPWQQQLYMAGRRQAGTADMEQLAQRIANSADPYEQFALARGGQKMTKGELSQSYFITNVLSGVQTQLRNTFGNFFNLAIRNTVVPLLKSPIDMAWSKVTGAPRQAFAGEALHRLVGMYDAVGGGLADGLWVMQHGFSKELVDDMIAGTTAVDLGRREFRGGGKNPWNIVGRSMDAVDRFFLALNKGAEERAWVYNRAVAALRQGEREITPDALAPAMMQARVALQNDSAARQEILRAALEGVYREPLGPMAKRLGLLKKDIPAMNYVIPFVNTVSNIFRQGYEHTPLSLVAKGLKAAKAGDMSPFGASRNAQESMLAKGAFGTIATLPLAVLAAQGRISGNGPRDMAERQQLMDTGWRPNSILLPLPAEVARKLGASQSDTGQYWVNYALFQPLSIPMSITANAFEAAHNIARSEEKAVVDLGPTREIAQALQGIAKSALSQSYLQGLFALVGAVQSDESMADMWLQNMAKAFVPFSGFWRGVSRSMDPVVRKPRGVLQAVQADLPGVSQNIPPRIGRYGEPITRERPGWAAGFFVPEIEGQKADPVDMELSRLGVYLPRPAGRVEIRDRAGNARKLSQQDEQMAAEARGVSRRAVLLQLMQSPQYRQTPDVFKRLLVRRALNQASRFGSEAARYGIVTQNRNVLEQILARPRQLAAGAP